MPSAETARLVAELTLKDKMTPALKKADASLRTFDKSTANTQKSLGKFAGNVGKAFAIGGAAIVAGGVLSVNAAADFESAFAGVRKTVDATEPEFEALSDAFRQMAKEIPISAAELAGLGEAAGALGIEGTKNIEEFARVTALLGVTTDLTAEDAANSLGVLANVLGLTGDEYDNFASSLVALGNAGASTESQIISIAERAGAAGELIGLSTDQVLGLSSAVASLGIEEEAAGSALQKFFIDTSKAVAGGGKDLAKFAKIAGKSTKTFADNFEKDAGAALQDFLAGLGKLSQGDQLRALEDLGFNDVRITRTLLGLAGNTELVAEQMGIANTAFKENTALTKEADERFKTFDSQLQITKNVLNDIAITIGSKLLPKLVPLLQKFNLFVSENQPAIEKFGEDVAAAFEDVADAVGRVDWDPFIDGLKFTAEVGRTAIGIFQSMPDWLQKLIVAGFAVNKLTGGLVTSLGKDIFGTLGAQFFARGASPANPLWVQQAGLPGGKGGLPGGAAPGLLGIGAAPLTAAAIGAVVVAGLQSVSADIIGGIAGAITGNARTGAAVEQVVTSTGTFSGPLDRLLRALQGDFRSGLEVAQDLTKESTSQEIKAALATQVATTQQTAANQVHTNERLESIRGQQASANAAAIVASNSEKAQIAAASVAQQAAQARTTEAARSAAAAIRDKDLSLSLRNVINVTTKVSVRDSINNRESYVSYQRYQS